MSKVFTYEVTLDMGLLPENEWLCQTFIDGRKSFSEYFETEQRAISFGERKKVRFYIE